MGTNLRDIVNRQKNALAEFENELKAIENSDLKKENEQLKSEIEKLRAKYLKFEHDVKLLSEQNANLKNSLYEQVYNEKVKIINESKEKMVCFFFYRAWLEYCGDNLYRFKINGICTVARKIYIGTICVVRLYNLYDYSDYRNIQNRIKFQKARHCFVCNKHIFQQLADVCNVLRI